MSQRATAPFGPNLVAVVTPFTPDGALDETGVARVITHLLDGGVDGIVVAGTTGESPTLTDDELEFVIGSAAQLAAGRAAVIAGVGTYDTRTSIENARLAARAGANGLLVVTPYYSRPTQDGVIAHFHAIADATELPVMVYDIPARTSLALTADTLRTLAKHPRIVAVKDAKGDLAEAMAILNSTDLAYYCGIDELNLPYLAAGAAGLVSVVANVAPQQIGDLIAAVAANDLASARAINSELQPLTTALMSTAPGVVTTKAALVEAGVIDHPSVRLPHVELTQEQRVVVAAATAVTLPLPAE